MWTLPKQNIVTEEDARPPPYSEGEFGEVIQAPRYSEVSYLLLEMFFLALIDMSMDVSKNILVTRDIRNAFDRFKLLFFIITFKRP